jgi:glycosyltransferase involved in cell wall biosynthesis/GT2 family glycosyltransferase
VCFARPPAPRRPWGAESVPLHVAIVDMQPISPAIGGGRLRLLGLYHGLGGDCQATYLGSYDWPGQPSRTAQLSATLTEHTVPLSEEHFAAADRWRDLAGGRVVIDVAFPLLAHLSPAFVNAAREVVAEADVVVFSHPWIFPLVADRLGNKLVVYDAQNVEGVLRAELLGAGGIGELLSRRVALVEAELCRRADLVLACSPEDRGAFQRIYRVDPTKVALVSNGAFTEVIGPAEAAQRAAARRAEGLGDDPVCLFMGSLYPPNVDAAAFIAQNLAPALPGLRFVVAGGVGDALGGVPVPSNVTLTGVVSAERHRALLAAADLAVNPVLTGSGTNVKMFEFMAAGLPIVTTPAGARGIPQDGDEVFLVSESDGIAAAIARLVEDPRLAGGVGRTARRHAVTRYSWETISERLGHLLRRAWQTRRCRRPYFSVIVPTLGRPQQLTALLRRLEMQTCKDFEVVVVDQNPIPSEPPATTLDLALIRTPHPGAARSRNTAALCARGVALAFTDDDCEPLPDWLAKARGHFDHPATVGVEGRIMGHPGVEEEAHWVQNEGIEGLGFLTANLLLRRETFVRVGGFDESFDHPHFREDSDLAWRCLAWGRIPFAEDVLVYHAPHASRRSEEKMERAFAKDALLYKRHPHAYRCLHARERHSGKDSYRRGLLRGAEEYGVDVTPLLEPARGGPVTDWRGTVLFRSVPQVVAAGTTFTTKLTVTNEGDVGWRVLGDDDAQNAVHLSYRWFDAGGQIAVLSGARTSLPYDVKPGEALDASCRVLAPTAAGAYVLLVTLVQEGVSWADQDASMAAVRQLTVVAGPPGR